MTRLLYRVTLTCALALFAAAGAGAQGIEGPYDDHDHEGAAGHAACGTMVFDDGKELEALANTARNNPAAYQTIIEQRKQKRSRSIAASADGELIWGFSIRDRVSGQYVPIYAALMFQGRRVRIWVDVEDTSFVKKNTLRLLARGLDSVTGSASRDPNKGIIENDEDVFGLPPLNRFDDPPSMIEDFLLTDIKDNYVGGNVLGFFSPWDQTDYDGSNRMNILYIDTRPGLSTQTTGAINNVLSTLAHEYQHLIHHRWNKQSETLYNEGCSETASTICGYKDRANTGFLSNTNIPLFRWSDGSVYQDLENDYQRAMTFVRYLYEQYGESFLNRLVATTSTGMKRIDDALTASGHAPEWRSALKGFAAANWVLRNYPDSRYTYRLQLSNSIPKVTQTYTEDFPNSVSATVQSYASAYYSYNYGTAGGMRVKPEGSVQNFAVMAIMYQGTQIVDVRELQNGVDNTFGETVGYTRVVLAVVNLATTAQEVTLNVQKLTSGVEEVETAPSSLTLTGVAPNPASNRVEVSFRTDRAAPLTLELFDMQGRLVKTIVDGEYRQASEGTFVFSTEGLPATVYVLRLSNGERTETRSVVVVR